MGSEKKGKGKEGKEKGEERERKGEGKEGKGKGRERERKGKGKEGKHKQSIWEHNTACINQTNANKLFDRQKRKKKTDHTTTKQT
jgi:hypothetical protein